MGSGLILLLIVGAWLAVLVPMALRSHEASALATVDKFSDAMRVLSRRGPGGRSEAAPADGPDGAEHEGVDEPGSGRGARARVRLARALRPRLPHSGSRLRRRRDRRALPPAARRLRALLVLLAAALLTLVGAVVGPLWMLVPHLVVDALLVVFLCWLRASAVARAEREWRIAMGERRSASSDTGPILPAEEPDLVEAWRTVPARVAGIPSRMPRRDELDPRPERLVPVPRTAGAPARGAQGEPWQPVPLPVPTYVTAPRAPRRAVPSLAHSGEGGSMLASAERSLGNDDQAPGLEHILGRRRAVGD